MVVDELRSGSPVGLAREIFRGPAQDLPFGLELADLGLELPIFFLQHGVGRYLAFRDAGRAGLLVRSSVVEVPVRLRSARTQLRRVSRLTPRSLPMPSKVWLGSDRYNATASALNSAEYAFLMR
ncbi:hypothetical protein GON09_005436 [Rhodococcus sp. B50]|nr:hypothetical protein [Rhodococcus sp. B50]